MCPLTSSVLSILLFCCVTVHCLTDQGHLQVGGIGSVRVAGGNCGVDGNTISLSQDRAPRVYLMSGTSFYRFPNMLGKSIQFTVDVSKAGCGCNAAVNLIELPNEKNADYYCDAQCPGGDCCNEVAIFEANAYAMAATLRCADGTVLCRWGHGINFRPADGYGPGSKIDTNKPYDVIMSFVETSGELSAVNVKLAQGLNSISGTLENSGHSMPGYVSGLTSAVQSQQLVMAISYWSGDMNWLDGCGDHCDKSKDNVVSFSNFHLLDQVAAMSEDEAAYSSSSFVLSSSFFAVIALSVLVVVLAIIVIVVVVIPKRNTIETV